MSLFHVQEWFNVAFPGAHSLCVANLVERREQLIVGTLDGTLTVLDPGKESENRQEVANLVELNLGRPILQLLVGNFLPAAFDENVLAVLMPNSLLFLRLINTSESFACEQVFEHRIGGASAFNMCSGFFGRSVTLLLCVQNLQGVLHIFEAENKVLQRPLPDILHPGPLGYSSADWTQPLGDIILQMIVLNMSRSADEPSSPDAVQPSILVLCKRALHCVTHGGNPRFTIRLQTVALCVTVLSHWKDAHIPLCIGNGTKTVLFYSDTRLIWSGQLPFVPQHIGTCTFNDSLRSLLALLSDEGNLLIGYLGTEPSLFRMPVTESRFIDFESRKKELREFEEIIWRSGRESKDTNQQGIDVRIEVDDQSASFNAMDGVPSATLSVSVSSEEEGRRSPSTVILQSELTNVQGTQWSTFQQSEKAVSFSTKIFCHERPVFDPRCQICTLSSAGIRFANFSVPLPVICREVNVQRQANFKLSLDSNRTALDISTMFPEFTENKDKTSLGLQPFFGDQNSAVSLFVSAKTNRYRIQSDSCDFLFAVLSSIVERVRRLQPDVQLRCPIPMHLFVAEIAKYIEAENQFLRLEKDACRMSVQMRQVETVFLGDAKSGDGENQLANIRMLLSYTYDELIESLDKMAGLRQLLSHEGRRSVRSLLNLMAALFELNELNLPFDGRILDGTDQRLNERIAQLLFPSEDELSSDLNGAEIGRMLADLLEKDCGKLGGIVEEDENDEEEAEGMLAEAIAKSEQSLGLADLRNGSLPARELDEFTR
uniref:Bardet-Biedl syndrome 9 n=1 Tax=Globodera pallida TaxID=36090 RepID=A0A183BQH7_GLOPA